MFENGVPGDNDPMATLKLPLVDIPIQRSWFSRLKRFRLSMEDAVHVPAATIAMSFDAEDSGLLILNLLVVNFGRPCILVDGGRLRYASIMAAGIEGPALGIRASLSLPGRSHGTFHVSAKLHGSDVRSLARIIAPGMTRRSSPTAGTDVRGDIFVERGSRRRWIPFEIRNITPYVSFAGSALEIGNG